MIALRTTTITGKQRADPKWKRVTADGRLFFHQLSQPVTEVDGSGPATAGLTHPSAVTTESAGRSFE